MKRLLVGCLVAAFPSLAYAQCNPTLPGTCAPNDPVLFGLQQEQQSRDMQQREMMMQHQKLQQIERQNMQRYEAQERNMTHSTVPSSDLRLPQIIAPNLPARPAHRHSTRHHAAAQHHARHKRG